jgi:glycine cleavage system regulatory protein
MSDLVFCLIGPDRPGLVEAVADRVAAHGGNWLESRMAQLSGRFAGILRVELQPEGMAGLTAALRELEAEGFHVWALAGSAGAAEPSRVMELSLVGQDHPGIVRDISQVLSGHHVNIEELATDRVSAPMAGGHLFNARARLNVPPGVDTQRLRAELERIAHDLMVELTLVESAAPPG